MAEQSRTGCAGSVSWKSVRLELARTATFPAGSVGRTYLLRLPLDEEGLIDEVALHRAPTLATVHRYWPNEADMFGYVARTPTGWALSCAVDEADEGTVFYLEKRPIREEQNIMLRGPDGDRLPFRVASVRPLA